MKEFKGTKGDWRVEKNQEFSNAYYLYPTHPFIEQDANAKLMASAPELLEALQIALQVIEACDYDKNANGSERHWTSRVKKAISKALGEDV